jgi:hypothetical protein
MPKPAIAQVVDFKSLGVATALATIAVLLELVFPSLCPLRALQIRHVAG